MKDILVVRLATVWGRHHDYWSTQYPQTIIDKQSLSNITKPAPAEDCNFSHRTEQMAAYNRNIIFKKDNDFLNNRTEC